MQRVMLKGLRSKKQLAEITDRPVLCAGFTNDTNFQITFSCEDRGKRDLVISFDTRSPHVYISEEYKEV